MSVRAHNTIPLSRLASKGWLAALILTLGLVAPATAQKVLINEVAVTSTNATSGLEGEYVEIYTSTPRQPLGGISILAIDGSALGTIGKVAVRIDLPRDAASNGENLYVVANQRARELYRGLIPDMVFDQSATAFPNGAQTILLVRTASAPVAGSVLKGEERLDIVDSVALAGTGTADRVFFNAPVVGPDLETNRVPAGAFRIIDGRDREMPTDFHMVAAQGPGRPENTPGRLNTSGFTYPPASFGRDVAMGTPGPAAPEQRQAAITWSRDPNITFSQASRTGQPFAIMFSSSDTPGNISLLQSLNSSPLFAQAVRQRGLNLCLVDVTMDAAGREWAQRCRVVRVPSLVVYAPNGDEMSRLALSMTDARGNDIDRAVREVEENVAKLVAFLGER